MIIIFVEIIDQLIDYLINCASLIENQLFQNWKLPFPYSLHWMKNLLNTKFSINAENFHSCIPDNAIFRFHKL